MPPSQPPQRGGGTNPDIKPLVPTAELLALARKSAPPPSSAKLTSVDVLDPEVASFCEREQSNPPPTHIVALTLGGHAERQRVSGNLGIVPAARIVRLHKWGKSAPCRASDIPNLYPAWPVDMSNILDAMERVQDSFMFSKPVDARKLNIPDYYVVIRQPICIADIRARLRATGTMVGLHARKGRYKHPGQFAADVRLMLRNCELYNGVESAMVKETAAPVHIRFMMGWGKFVEDHQIIEDLSCFPPPKEQLLGREALLKSTTAVKAALPPPQVQRAPGSGNGTPREVSAARSGSAVAPFCLPSARPSVALPASAGPSMCTLPAQPQSLPAGRGAPAGPSTSVAPGPSSAGELATSLHPTSHQVAGGATGVALGTTRPAQPRARAPLVLLPPARPPPTESPLQPQSGAVPPASAHGVAVKMPSGRPDVAHNNGSDSARPGEGAEAVRATAGSSQVAAPTVAPGPIAPEVAGAPGALVPAAQARAAPAAPGVRLPTHWPDVCTQMTRIGDGPWYGVHAMGSGGSVALEIQIPKSSTARGISGRWRMEGFPTTGAAAKCHDWLAYMAAIISGGSPAALALYNDVHPQWKLNFPLSSQEMMWLDGFHQNFAVLATAILQQFPGLVLRSDAKITRMGRQAMQGPAAEPSPKPRPHDGGAPHHGATPAQPSTREGWAAPGCGGLGPLPLSGSRGEKRKRDEPRESAGKQSDWQGAGAVSGGAMHAGAPMVAVAATSSGGTLRTVHLNGPGWPFRAPGGVCYSDGRTKAGAAASGARNVAAALPASQLAAGTSAAASAGAGLCRESNNPARVLSPGPTCHSWEQDRQTSAARVSSSSERAQGPDTETLEGPAASVTTGMTPGRAAGSYPGPLAALSALDLQALRAVHMACGGDWAQAEGSLGWLRRKGMSDGDILSCFRSFSKPVSVTESGTTWGGAGAGGEAGVPTEPTRERGVTGQARDQARVSAPSSGREGHLSAPPETPAVLRDSHAGTGGATRPELVHSSREGSAGGEAGVGASSREWPAGQASTGGGGEEHRGRGLGCTGGGEASGAGKGDDGGDASSDAPTEVVPDSGGEEDESGGSRGEVQSGPEERAGQ